MNRLLIITLSVFLLVLVACGGSQVRWRENISQVNYSVSSVKLLPGEQLGVLLGLQLDNPLEEPVILDSIISDVYLNDLRIAEMKHLDHQRIEAQSSKVIQLRLLSSLGLTQWIKVIGESEDLLALKFKGHAWSKVEYLGFWDSMKETDFEFKKSIPKAEVQAQIQQTLQNSMKQFLGLPGAILNPGSQAPLF